MLKVAFAAVLVIRVFLECVYSWLLKIQKPLSLRRISNFLNRFCHDFRFVWCVVVSKVFYRLNRFSKDIFNWSLTAFFFRCIYWVIRIVSMVSDLYQVGSLWFFCFHRRFCLETVFRNCFGSRCMRWTLLAGWTVWSTVKTVFIRRLYLALACIVLRPMTLVLSWCNVFRN